MRFGLVTPVMQRNPRFDPPPWEDAAGIEEVATLASAADDLGYEFLSFPEHVALPTAVASRRGGIYWAPLPTMGYVAAATRRIRLAAHTIVVGLHHPVEVVKEYGTLDLISGGRLILGVGVGSLREEFDLLGAPFDDRGPRADDALAAIRAGFADPHPRHDGPYFAYDDWLVDPCGVQGHLPIWVGGRTRRSLRRALRLGDGWVPFGLDPDEIARMLAAEDDLRGERRGPVEVVLAPEPPVAPDTDPDGTLATLRAYADVGATMLNVRFRHRSLAHYLEQLEALMALWPEARAMEGEPT